MKATGEDASAARGVVAQACIAAVCAGLDEGDAETRIWSPMKHVYVKTGGPAGGAARLARDFHNGRVRGGVGAVPRRVDAESLLRAELLRQLPGSRDRIRNTEKVQGGATLHFTAGCGGAPRDVRRSLLSDAFGFECMVSGRVGRDRISSYRLHAMKETMSTMTER